MIEKLEVKDDNETERLLQAGDIIVIKHFIQRIYKNISQAKLIS